MKMSTPNLLITFAIFQVVVGGLPSYHCPESPGSEVYIPCEGDCIKGHCSPSGGSCASNFNCKCNEFTKCPPPGKGSHCRRSDGLYGEIYTLLCKLDCVCHHGAEDGECDFSEHGCKCIGDDPNNTRCPDSKDLRKTALEYLTKVSA